MKEKKGVKESRSQGFKGSRVQEKRYKDKSVKIQVHRSGILNGNNS